MGQMKPYVHHHLTSHKEGTRVYVAFYSNKALSLGSPVLRKTERPFATLPATATPGLCGSSRSTARTSTHPSTKATCRYPGLQMRA